MGGDGNVRIRTFGGQQNGLRGGNFISLGDVETMTARCTSRAEWLSWTNGASKVE